MILSKARYRLYRTHVKCLPNVPEGALETKLAQMLGADYVVPVSMARVGIYLLVQELLKTRPTNEVVMSPFTIIDVVNMVVAAGGKPRFVDIEESTCGMNPIVLKQVVSEKTGLVLVTHLHGVCADVAQIAEICKKFGVPVVEDAAQALGATVNGKRVGTVATAGVFSFGLYKHINAYYGGVIVTQDEALADRLRQRVEKLPSLRTRILIKRGFKALVTNVATHPLIYGVFTFRLLRWAQFKNQRWVKRYLSTELNSSLRAEVPSWYFSKLSRLQISLAFRQLDRLDADSEVRKKNAEIYWKSLNGIPGLKLPPAIFGRGDIYISFPIQCEEREKLYRWMLARGRDISLQHLRNCENLMGNRVECQVAERLAKQLLLLPTYPEYGTRQVHETVRILKLYFNS